MHHKYVEYRAYWVEGLPEGVEDLLAAAEAGLQLRGVIWAHVESPPELPELQVGDWVCYAVPWMQDVLDHTVGGCAVLCHGCKMCPIMQLVICFWLCFSLAAHSHLLPTPHLLAAAMQGGAEVWTAEGSGEGKGEPGDADAARPKSPAAAVAETKPQEKGGVGKKSKREVVAETEELPPEGVCACVCLLLSSAFSLLAGPALRSVSKFSLLLLRPPHERSLPSAV